MADHLILSSLQAPPFTIFRCSLHRPWGFPGGIRFSAPQFRLTSSQLQLVNSTSSSHSSSSSPDKFDLVSTTELEDGSLVFRFGDASEIEKNLEIEAKVKKQQVKIAEKVSDVSKKQGIKDSDFSKAKELVNSNIETGSEEEERAAPSNVIKIKDRKRVRAPTKKKKETPASSSSVNVSQSEDKDEAKIASVSNLSSGVSVPEAIPTSTTEAKETATVSNSSSIVSVAEAISTSSTEEKVVALEQPEPIIENEVIVESDNVEPPASEVMEKGGVNEIGASELNGYQQITENRLKVEARPRSSTSQNGSQSEDLKEVSAHVSTIERDDHLDVRENPTKTIEAEENLVVEPTATAAVSPNEPTATPAVPPDEHISRTEVTHNSIDEIAETPVIDTSEVANVGENVAPTIEEELAVRDTEADNGSLSETASDTKDEDLQHHAPVTADLESIEVTSGREEVVSKAFYLESRFASLKSPFEALGGREDAYFISHNNWLGIGDGVSQWSFDGINKGMYAQELMRNCEQIISNESAEIPDPVQVLHRSVNETKSPGSSTALIAHLDNNELHVANIGDSGFMVIRNGTVLQRSSPMFHHFWYPVHVTQGDDVLKLAEVYHVNVEEGDVIIAATDGLFDNLYEKEIASIVCRSLEQNLEPQKIAEVVAAEAHEVGLSGAEKTPFADAAKEEGYDGYKGGKLDDVTVIVSLVKRVSI